MQKEERKELIRLAVFEKECSWKSQHIYTRILGDMTLRGWKPTLRLIHPGHLLHWTPHIYGFLLFVKVTHGLTLLLYEIWAFFMSNSLSSVWGHSVPLAKCSVFKRRSFKQTCEKYGTYGRIAWIESCYFLSISLKLKIYGTLNFS